MQTSIKYQKGKSPPGKPPYAHRRVTFTRQKVSKKTGETKIQRVSPLRELIYFAYDGEMKTVVAGPVKFGDSGAPGRLEKGGPGVFRDSNTGRMKRGVWKARPFAKPAGDAEIKRFPQI